MDDHSLLGPVVRIWESRRSPRSAAVDVAFPPQAVPCQFYKINKFREDRAWCALTPSFVVVMPPVILFANLG